MCNTRASSTCDHSLSWPAGLQYSGNVLVYSAVSPCDGDWFGGVDAANAEAFLDALADADISGSGGVSEEGLRPLWRGRISLSKEEQLEVLCPAAKIRHLACMQASLRQARAATLLFWRGEALIGHARSLTPQDGACATI